MLQNTRRVSQIHSDASFVRKSNLLIALETYDSKSTLVCSGFADVEQPTCALTFTGQGSVKIGMGMDLHQESDVSRAVFLDQVRFLHSGSS